MRRLLAAVALTALTACGGGGSPKAAPSATTTTAPPVTKETQAVRDSVAKAVASCPCAVSVWVAPTSFEPYDLTGTWDPRTSTVDLHAVKGKERLRIVDGHAFLDLGTGWTAVDFGKVTQSRPRQPLAALWLADPRVAVSFAAHATIATESSTVAGATQYDVEYDTKAVDPGPWAAPFAGFFTDPTVLEGATVGADGRLARVTLKTPDGDATVFLRLVIGRGGVPAGPFPAPKAVATVDASTVT